MLFLNNHKFEPTVFPNGEIRIGIEEVLSMCGFSGRQVITWKYDNDSELFHLRLLLEAIRAFRYNPIALELAYMPYSRMDRTDNGRYLVSLKYVCREINDMNFQQVLVWDPHSEVTMTLLDRAHATYPSLDMLPYIAKAVNFSAINDFIFFPDNGATKKYVPLLKQHYKILTGVKQRNFDTGSIDELTIQGPVKDIEGSTVIIVDDLCSRGGTFSIGARKLKILGASKVYLLVTHCESNIHNGELLTSESPVDKVFCTDSIYREVRGSEKKVQLYKPSIYGYSGGEFKLDNDARNESEWKV